MKEFSIGEVSILLNVKRHVLRYWEKEIPFLKPKKNLGGHRAYTEREINLLFRLKYLLYERRLPLESAKQAIWEEITTQRIDLKLAVQEIRGELLRILEQLQIQKKDIS